jgi:hypothetical protein
MTWTATILQIDKAARTAVVKYDNGTESFTDQITAQTMEEGKQIIINKINQLNASTPLVEGVVDTTVAPVVQPVVPTPTQAELDRQTYFDDLVKLRKAKELVDLGVIPATNTQYVALQTRIKNEFKIEYLS